MATEDSLAPLHDKCLVRFGQPLGQRQRRDERQVRRLVSALGKINAGRGLRLPEYRKVRASAGWPSRGARPPSVAIGLMHRAEPTLFDRAVDTLPRGGAAGPL